MSGHKQENQQVKLKENQFIELKLPDSDSKLVVEYRKDYKQMTTSKTDKHENSLGNDQQKKPSSSVGRDSRPKKGEMKEDQYKTDFVIITALEEEFMSVLNKFPKRQKILSDSKYQAYHAELTTNSSDQQHYEIIIACQTRMGQASAAALTILLCEQYKPHYILLVGIAGGKKNKVDLGDVMIADSIVDASEGEIKDGRRHPRWKQFPVDSKLLGESKHNLANQNWHNYLDKTLWHPRMPRVHHAPIFSSCDVIKDDQITSEYQETWNKAIGIEMESGGVAIAVFDYIKLKPDLLMIRSVSDFADKDKNLGDEDKNLGDEETRKKRACDVAAAYTYAFLESGPVPALNETQSEFTRADR